MSHDGECCDNCDSSGTNTVAGNYAVEGVETPAPASEMSALPVPRAFADSRRSSAASAVSAASLHPDK